MKKKRTYVEPVFKEYNQEQPWLLPPSVDEMIPKHHLVRTINAAIDAMDLSFFLKQYKGGGCSSYHPVMLLKVFAYAYTQKIFSSRLIAKALRENIHFMWISGNNQPDFRTLNRFRSDRLKDNMERIFAALMKLLLDKGFVKYENYFLDGTKIEADANKYSFVWKKATETQKERLKFKVRELLQHIEDVNDKENQEYGNSDLEELGEGVEITAEELKKTVEKMNEHLKELDSGNEQKELKKAVKAMNADYLPRLERYESNEKIFGKRNSFSKTDHDATFMRMKEDPMMNGQLKAGYNVQIGTENQFILGYSIHQKPTDSTTLIPHLDKVQKISGRKPNHVIADSGYGSEENYAYLGSNGIEAYVKYQYYNRDTSRTFKKEIYHPGNLEYDAVRDEYICPSGQRMKYVEDKIRVSENGYIQTVRVYQSEDCRWCRKRPECHRSKYNRRIEINPVLNEFRRKAIAMLKSEKGTFLRKKRSVEVETVFGHLKHNWGFKRFRLRGIEKVSTEWGMLSFSFNLFKMNLAGA